MIPRTINRSTFDITALGAPDLGSCYVPVHVPVATKLGHAIRKAVSTTHQSLPNVGKVGLDRKSISTSVSDHMHTAQAASFPLRRSPLPALGLTSKRFLPQCLGCQQDPPHRLTQRGAGSPSTQGEADAGFSTPHRLERTGITVPAHGSPSWAGYNSGAPPHT